MQGFVIVLINKPTNFTANTECLALIFVCIQSFNIFRWTLIGIVSAGYSCAKRGQPGIYHRVARTSDWVSYSINS